MKAIKHIRAGLLNIEIIGTVPDRDFQKRRRGSRSRPTSAAMQFYNNKSSWQELELTLANNFGRGDYVVTLTYDDDHLPQGRSEANKRLSKFFRKLRPVLKMRGAELKYLYVTEGFHDREIHDRFGDDGELEHRRWHHHVVINTGDIDEIRSLWENGENVKAEPVDIHYYRELAKYLTKEAREFGRSKPGERTWNCSRNLNRDYTVEYIDLPTDSVTLTAPEGAIDYMTFREKNPYGYADCIGARYLLYPQETPPPPSYAAGRKSNRAL